MKEIVAKLYEAKVDVDIRITLLEQQKAAIEQLYHAALEREADWVPHQKFIAHVEQLIRNTEEI